MMLRTLYIGLILLSISAASTAEIDYGGVPVADLLQRGQLGAGDWKNLVEPDGLQGWTPKIRGYQAGENFADTFRVDGDVISVSYQGYDKFKGRFGHLFYDTPYSHYLLSLDYRFVGDQARGGAGWAFENSGVMIHSQSAASMGLKQDFPISVEVQLLGGSGKKKRPTANVCTPGTHIEMAGKLKQSHCIDSSSQTFPGPVWVHLELVVLGNELIEHRINGDSVLSYQKPVIGGGVVAGYNKAEKKDGQPLSRGFISLQSESHPVEFRHIELLNLSGCGHPQAANYRPYLAENDNNACLEE
jgi:hypothetical protein